MQSFQHASIVALYLVLRTSYNYYTGECPLLAMTALAALVLADVRARCNDLQSLVCDQGAAALLQVALAVTATYLLSSALLGGTACAWLAWPSLQHYACAYSLVNADHASHARSAYTSGVMQCQAYAYL